MAADPLSGASVGGPALATRYLQATGTVEGRIGKVRTHQVNQLGG
jgi:hypothetical protein